MKKILCAVLALTLVLGLAACGSKAETPAESTAVTAPSALEVLETVWGAYAEEEKFPIVGGSMNGPVDGAPGSFPLDDENISFNLLIPAEQLGSVTEAASMIHMMNANTFTGSAYTLAEGVSAADFTAAMADAIKNNQWMCGFPEELLIGTCGNCVVVAFGAADLMDVFEAHLTAGYPDFSVTVEPLM